MARKAKKHSARNGTKVTDDKAGIVHLLDTRIKTTTDKRITKKENEVKEACDKNALLNEYSSLFSKFEAPIVKQDVTLYDDADVDERKNHDNIADYQEESVEIADGSNGKQLSDRKRRKLAKPSLSTLKSSTPYPEIIEWYDCDAHYPYLLATIKTSKNVVPIPGHWQMKREYLSGRSLLEKRPFELPEIIKQTDIEQMRNTLPTDGGDNLDISLKEASRARAQPKLGSLDIDYRKLYDVFFKLGAHWKPDILLPFGDLYYENRNLYEEAQWKKTVKEKTPGKISSELREIMKLPEGQLPPWCMKMKNIGMPPGYPTLKIAGLNWEIENLKGDVYGELAVPNNFKNKSRLFGTILELEDESKENDVRENDKQGSSQINNESQTDTLTKLDITRQKVATKQEHTKNIVTHVNKFPLQDDKTPKKLYTVLKERTADAKASYEFPGNVKQDEDSRQQDNDTTKTREAGQDENIENFKF